MKRNRNRIHQQRVSVRRRRIQMESLEARQLLAAGPYAPAAGQAGSTAIAHDDAAIVGWARQVVDYSPGTFVTSEWSDPAEALGPAQGEFDRVVSLGRGGSLTLSFDPPIRDGLGPDFAVFENSFSDTFLELGYVEVSSDGVNFTRFVSDSRTQSSVGSFGELDPTNLNNLAGKYRGGFGVPFDLAQLASASSLDVTAVTHVRLVDIIGNGNSVDSQGDPIFDPTPTSQSAGLDVDGVAALHQVQYGNIVVDLETLGDGLGDAVFDNGVAAGGSFEEQEISLNNDYSSQFDSWRGFSISQATDTTTAGFTNQYSAVTGSGRLNSETYAVGFYDSSATDNSVLPTIELDQASGSQFDSLWVTNTTYAALSMRDGDMFAKKFGGTSGNDPDFLQLNIIGVNSQGVDVGTVDVMLADFRFANNNEDFILENWRLVDLTSLLSARSLRFEMTSSDVGPFGINTPAYVAVDDITLRRAAVSFDVSATETLEPDSVTGRITRPNENTISPLTISLMGAGSDAVTFPESVTIPSGAMFVDFAITPDADSFASGNRTVEITASADNLLPTTRRIEIVDDESAGIGFSQSTVTVTEGAGEDAATLTLRRNDADISLPLTVTLSVDGNANLLTVPTTLVFESDEREATVSIGVRDNEEHASVTEVTVRATTAGRLPATTVVRVLEDDLPTLIASVNEVTVRESNPDLAASVTLRRNVADLSEPLDVTLLALDDGPVDFPAQVTIPANQSSVVIQVSALDDDFANTNETVRLQMTHPNYVSAIIGVRVVDNDAATLQVTFADDTNQPLAELVEGSIANVTVSRTTASTSGALDVALGYSLGERVVGPNATTIPDGSRSQTFSIRVLGDNLSTGDLPLVIEAEVVGLQTGRGEISVQDADQPSLGVNVEGGSLSEVDALAQGDFENFALAMAQGEFINNAGESEQFSSGPFELANSFDDSFGFDSWSGFSISHGVDRVTPGFGNQYSAIAGSGADGSATYAVGFASSPITIERDASQGQFHSFAVTNTTYAAISMRDGDNFAKKFGGETGDDPDFLLLTINGLDSSGESIGAVEFYLADFRFTNNTNDTIIDEWTTVDLSSIASAQTLSMQLSSSDNGSFGMNTPAYFAIDNLRLLPDESSLPTIEVTRQTNGIDDPLEVHLSHDRDDLWLPSSATIAEGQDRVSVPLAWWGNDVVDATRSWTVEASGVGVQTASETIELVDDDANKLSIQVSTETINESAGVVLADLEDAGQFLMPESFNNGSNQRGGFTSQGVAFDTDYNTDFGSWSGWAVSSVTDVTTVGFTNQYSAYADVTSETPGGGAGGSQTFAVANGYGPTPPTIDLGQAEVVDRFADAAFHSVAITNTTYAALSMQNGDSFAKRFGGESGDDPDFFLLTIEGVDDNNESAGTVEFYLADYRFEDNTDDYIVNDWTTIDLSSLAAASKLTFSLSSSDVGAFGMNTPAYFAIDNLLLTRSGFASESVVVHRNSQDLSEPLAVELNGADDDRLTIAVQAIIPAGQRSVRVPLSQRDNVTFDSSSQIALSVSGGGIEPGQTTVSIVDDETPGFVVSQSHENVLVGEGSTAEVFVHLESQPEGDVSVVLHDSNDGTTGNEDSGQRLHLPSASLTFTPENWEIPQAFVVSGQPDLLKQQDLVVRLEVTVDPATTDAIYAGARSQSAWIELQDYQPSSVSLVQADVALQLIEEDRSLELWRFDLDDDVSLQLSDEEQTFRLDPILGATGQISVDAGGGDDHVLLHSSRFDTVRGGDGNDQLTIAPRDASGGEPTDTDELDLVNWIRGRIAGFESIILGSTDMGQADDSMRFRFDSIALTEVFGDTPPLLASSTNHLLDLVGQWRNVGSRIEAGVVQQQLEADGIELSVATQTPWRNALRSQDVNASGEVSAVDALVIINRLNAITDEVLPMPSDAAELAGRYYDVSGDGRITARDALQVINWLNDNPSGVGSEPNVATEPSTFAMPLWPFAPRKSVPPPDLNQLPSPALAPPQFELPQFHTSSNWSEEDRLPSDLTILQPSQTDPLAEHVSNPFSPQKVDEVWSTNGLESETESAASPETPLWSELARISKLRGRIQ